MPYITPAHVAKVAGIDPNTARRFIGDAFPKKSGKRSQHRFEEEQLPELVALCQGKRQRLCRNQFNS
ncbi:MAG: hypothetical protein EOO38_30805, partial [Cytophagaceae bacterium]